MSTKQSGTVETVEVVWAHLHHCSRADQTHTVQIPVDRGTVRLSGSGPYCLEAQQELVLMEFDGRLIREFDQRVVEQVTEST